MKLLHMDGYREESVPLKQPSGPRRRQDLGEESSEGKLMPLIVETLERTKINVNVKTGWSMARVYKEVHQELQAKQFEKSGKN